MQVLLSSAELSKYLLLFQLIFMHCEEYIPCSVVAQMPWMIIDFFTEMSVVFY